MSEIVLEVGRKYSDYALARNGFIWREILSRNKHPVGTITSNGSKYILWLQNYAGYYSSEFELTFDSEENALARAKLILAEWDVADRRPTWIA